MTVFTLSRKAPDTVSAPAAPPTTGSVWPQMAASPMPFAPQPSAAPVLLIGRAVKITGQLESTEGIEIEGEVDGDVRGAFVRVGTSARVTGTVSAEDVELAGTIDGRIEATRVVLTATAHMSGEIIHKAMRIDAGAYLVGHCCQASAARAVTNVAALPPPQPQAALGRRGRPHRS